MRKLMVLALALAVVPPDIIAKAAGRETLASRSILWHNHTASQLVVMAGSRYPTCTSPATRGFLFGATDSPGSPFPIGRSRWTFCPHGEPARSRDRVPQWAQPN
jgi:hypothetical protein